MIDFYDFSGCAIFVSLPPPPRSQDGASPDGLMTLNLLDAHQLPQNYLTL